MSTSQQYQTYLTYVQNSMVYYTVLAALPVGIVGNLVSLYVYTRPNLNKKTNTGFLYGWLCAFNLFLILYFALVFQSYNLFGYTINFPCGLSLYLLRSVWCIVPWMQVVICFDRFVVVVFPLKKRFMAKKWVLCLIILGTLVFIFGANMANMLTNPVTIPWFGTTFTYCSITTVASVAASITGMIMRIYIPFGIMILFDIFVFRRLRASKAKVGVTNQTIQDRGQQKGKAAAPLSRKEYKFIVASLFIDLTFFLYYTPIAFFIAVSVANTFNPTILAEPLTSTFFNLFYFVGHLLVYLYSVSIVFIFTAFNRFFRDEIIRLLRISRFFPNIGNRNSTMTGTGSITNRN